jgi:hypothetical protein
MRKWKKKGKRRTFHLHKWMQGYGSSSNYERENENDDGQVDNGVKAHGSSSN